MLLSKLLVFGSNTRKDVFEYYLLVEEMYGIMWQLVDFVIENEQI